MYKHLSLGATVAENHVAVERLRTILDAAVITAELAHDGPNISDGIRDMLKSWTHQQALEASVLGRGRLTFHPVSDGHLIAGLVWRASDPPLHLRHHPSPSGVPASLPKPTPTSPREDRVETCCATCGRLRRMQLLSVCSLQRRN